MPDELAEDERVIETCVARFAQAMRDRLMANVDKGGWQGCNTLYLLARLDEECAELRAAVADNKWLGVGKDILNEAADVANFAMMIADVTAQAALPPPGGAMTAERELYCDHIGCPNGCTTRAGMCEPCIRELLKAHAAEMKERCARRLDERARSWRADMRHDVEWNKIAKYCAETCETEAAAIRALKEA